MENSTEKHPLVAILDRVSEKHGRMDMAEKMGVNFSTLNNWWRRQSLKAAHHGGLIAYARKVKVRLTAAELAAACAVPPRKGGVK